MKKIMSLIMTIILSISIVACSSSKGEAVATVNGKKIFVDEYEKILALNKQSIEYMYGTDIWNQEIEEGVKYSETFKDMVLEQMIYSELVYEEAKKEKLLPSTKEVDKAFGELKTSIESDEEYQKQLKSEGIDDDFLKEQQEKDLAWQNYKNHIEETSKVTDEEMKAYYNENEQGFLRDEIKASHILLSTVDKNKKPFSDKKKAEVKKKAEEVLKKVNNGEEFSALAKEYSDDKASAVNGGDLGFFGRGKMVLEFESVAYDMKVGEVSDLVETEYGYHIIKVTDKVNEQTSFEDAKETIKQNLLNEKYNDTIQKLNENADIEKKEDILKKVKL